MVKISSTGFQKIKLNIFKTKCLINFKLHLGIYRVISDLSKKIELITFGKAGDLTNINE